MRKIYVLTVVVLIALTAQGQKKIEGQNLSISSGKGALSSGILFNANFKRGNDLLNFTLGERDIYLTYMKKIGKFYTGPSIEFYHNVPTMGLITSLPIINKKKFSLSLMNWFGISAGIPGEKADFNNFQLLFFYQSAEIAYQRISLNGAILWYEKKWGKLFEFKYKQPLIENFGCFMSAGYNFYGDGDYLFKIGLNYTL